MSANTALDQDGWVESTGASKSRGILQGYHHANLGRTFLSAAFNFSSTKALRISKPRTSIYCSWNFDSSAIPD
jgi:hypothetical protein